MKHLIFLLLVTTLLSCTGIYEEVVPKFEPPKAHRFPDLVQGKTFYSNKEYLNNPLQGYHNIVDSTFYKFPERLDEHNYYLTWRENTSPDTVHILWTDNRFRRDRLTIYEQSLQLLTNKVGSKEAYIHMNHFVIGGLQVKKTSILVLY